MTGFTYDAFDASTVKEYLEKIEINPDFAVQNNVPWVSELSPSITLRNGKIATPNKHGDLSDEEFCNRHVADFHQQWGVRSIPQDGVYFRWTNRETEPELARGRTIRPSVNHLAQKTEAGLSVSAGPWLYFRMHSFCYFVSGKDLGLGSDGEPILDISTLEVHSLLLTRRHVLCEFYERNRALIASMRTSIGVSELDLFTLMIGACA
jgi:hypothetical protein